MISTVGHSLENSSLDFSADVAIVSETIAKNKNAQFFIIFPVFLIDELCVRCLQITSLGKAQKI